MQSSKAMAGSLLATGARPLAAFVALAAAGNGVQYLPPVRVMLPPSAVACRLHPARTTVAIVAAATPAIFPRTALSLGSPSRPPVAIFRRHNAKPAKWMRRRGNAAPCWSPIAIRTLGAEHGDA